MLDRVFTGCWTFCRCQIYCSPSQFCQRVPQVSSDNYRSDLGPGGISSIPKMLKYNHAQKSFSSTSCEIDFAISILHTAKSLCFVQLCVGLCKIWDKSHPSMLICYGAFHFSYHFTYKYGLGGNPSPRS